MKFTIKTVLCLCLSMMLVLPAHAQEGDEREEMVYSELGLLEYDKEMFKLCDNSDQHKENYTTNITQKEQDIYKIYQCKGLSKKTIDENKDFAMKQYVSTTKTNSPEQLQKDCQMSFDLWSQYVEQLENRQFSQEFCMYAYE